MAKAKSTPQKILLSTVKTLTFQTGQLTTSRRTSPIPQLTCAGPGCAFYTLESLQCQNSGSSYGSEDIQWTCSASLPVEFKLGATDVQCEGYSNADDPYVLKGSCGVEYRLLLTEKGEQRYAEQLQHMQHSKHAASGRSAAGDWGAYLFMGLFLGVIAWMAWSAWTNVRRRNARRGAGGGGRRGNGRPGGGGGGGGGGPGGGGGGGGGWWPGGGRGDGGYYANDNDDPPPPYTPKSPKANVRSSPQSSSRSQPWRPGFWSGALGGTAAGYAASAWQNRNQRGRNAGEGSSRGAGGSGGGGSASSGGFTSSYSSTGFGGTSRR